VRDAPGTMSLYFFSQRRLKRPPCLLKIHVKARQIASHFFEDMEKEFWGQHISCLQYDANRNMTAVKMVFVRIFLGDGQKKVEGSCPRTPGHILGQGNFPYPVMSTPYG